MMQPEVLQSFLQHDLDNHACDDHDFENMLPSDISKLPFIQDYRQAVLDVENVFQHVEEIEEISGNALDDVLRWWAESEDTDSFSPKFSSGNEVIISVDNIPMELTLPVEDMEIEGQTSLCNLLKAYGEAMEMGQQELANVIVGCINQKASPFGVTMERVAFNLFHSGNQLEYIKQESMKIFNSAFKAFYEIFPYGRFAHFTANSTIFEAVMRHSGKVHIIDFDMGEGVQWPPLLETIGRLKRKIKLTSISTKDQSCSFEKIRNRLLDYANDCGFDLEVQNVKIEDLAWYTERSNEPEFLAFNCMVGLPHMGRTRSGSEVMQFVRTAKKLLSVNKGIITLGDGESLERRKDYPGFGSYFDDYIMHYHALCESMERSFPKNLTKAKLAMESLFVWPCVSSFSWYHMWENDCRGESEFREKTGLKGWELSKESLMEAKELVKGTQSLYNIRVEGKNNNEMVLNWRETPLVRVSAWE